METETLPLPVQDNTLNQDDIAAVVQPLVVNPTNLPVSSMSVVAGMFITICVFMVLGIYCERHRRKRYYPYEWDSSRTTFAVPFFLYQLKTYEELQAEKRSLLSHRTKDITINIYTSRNKADSKYPKVKPQFPYFVTIPEEDEEDLDLPGAVFTHYPETPRPGHAHYPKSFHTFD